MIAEPHRLSLDAIRNHLGKPESASLSGLLHAFWASARSGEDKLALLRAYAEKRPTVRVARDPHAIRREHNRQRTASAWKGKRCFVCAAYASQEHHIVQIQHGGTNRPLNKVWICTPCHRQVHPFMAQPSADTPIGVVPFVKGTERSVRCPGCHQDVLSVKPLNRRRAVSSSDRPILLNAGAQPPYRTTDLHQPVCVRKAVLNTLTANTLRQLAKQDATATQDARWSDEAVRRAYSFSDGGRYGW